MSATLELSFYDDLKAESDLRRMAVVYNKTSIPLAKIDWDTSKTNGARAGNAFLEHKVEDYMQGFENGDTFPRPVMVKTPTGYLILSGNQRCEAIRRLVAAGRLPKTIHIDIYLVETTDKLLLEIIARSANVAHGEGASKEERIQHAVYCVRKLGMSTRDAAKAFLCSQTSINIYIKSDDVRADLQKAGINAHRLPNHVLHPLQKLDYDDKAKITLGSLIAQHTPTGERVGQVVAAIAQQKTQPARMQKIKEFEKELAAVAHTKNGHSRSYLNEHANRIPSRPWRDKAISLLTRTANFLESGKSGEAFTSLEELQITSKADAALVESLAKRLAYRLKVIVK